MSHNAKYALLFANGMPFSEVLDLHAKDVEELTEKIRKLRNDNECLRAALDLGQYTPESRNSRNW